MLFFKFCLSFLEIKFHSKNFFSSCIYLTLKYHCCFLWIKSWYKVYRKYPWLSPDYLLLFFLLKKNSDFFFSSSYSSPTKFRGEIWLYPPVLPHPPRAEAGLKAFWVILFCGHWLRNENESTFWWDGGRFCRGACRKLSGFRKRKPEDVFFLRTFSKYMISLSHCSWYLPNDKNKATDGGEQTWKRSALVWCPQAAGSTIRPTSESTVHLRQCIFLLLYLF